MVQHLAKLKHVEPHQIWHHEAHDFTPWLMANADALAEVLGIDLELTANEHPVGNFALDLIGRDLTNECVLIVENQLTGTDHGHLGQLLTYAAGTDASTVVWMATSFREEHRQALDWLNDLAVGNARFFGIEIGAVQIADSPPAPLFKVRAQPNDWHSQIASAAKSTTEMTGRSVLHLKFWEHFLERVHNEHPDWTNAQKPGTRNWFSMPCPFKGGPRFSLVFAADGKLRTELYIDYPDPEAVVKLYIFLFERAAELEAAYGSSLTWEELPDRRASRIADYAVGDVANVDKHNDYIDWFFKSCENLRSAISNLAETWNARLNTSES